MSFVMHKLLVTVGDVLSYHYKAVGMGSEFNDVVDCTYTRARSLTLVIFVSRVNGPNCI